MAKNADNNYDNCKDMAQYVYIAHQIILYKATLV